MQRSLLTPRASKITLVVFLLCGVGSVLGFLGRQETGVFTAVPPPSVSRPEDVPDVVLKRGEAAGAVSSLSGTGLDITADFYQTIIDNNLFAPLGTDLNPKPVPGANLTLVATFVSEDIYRSTAVIKHKTTGRHAVLSIGGVIGDFTLMKIRPKQVTFDHHGKRPVELHLPEPVFLNVKRR